MISRACAAFIYDSIFQYRAHFRAIPSCLIGALLHFFFFFGYSDAVAAPKSELIPVEIDALHKFWWLVPGTRSTSSDCVCFISRFNLKHDRTWIVDSRGQSICQEIWNWTNRESQFIFIWHRNRKWNLRFGGEVTLTRSALRFTNASKIVRKSKWRDRRTE